MKNIRYAVIGCGNIANDYHMPALAKVEHAEFIVACDLIEERARQAKEHYHAEIYCTDYYEVLSREDIDLVCIFTKIEAHAEIAIASAQVGKHVFMQKPFSKSVAEGRKIVQAFQDNHVRIIPSFMHHYFDESMMARKLIAEKTIGEIEFIRFRNATGNTRESVGSYGGSFMDIGAHGIDLIRFLTGAEVSTVCSRFTFEEESQPSVTGIEREEVNLLGNEVNAWMLYGLSNGATISHEIQWSQIGGTKRFEAEIYGTSGTIFLFTPETGHSLAYTTRKGGSDSMEYTWHYPDVAKSFFGYTHHKTIIESLRNADNSAQSGKDGLAVIQVCEAARRSNREHGWVEVLN